MKISGLATGMDTESIIKDLMQASRIPLDKITQKKQYMEWMLDDYRSINRDLRATSDKVFDTVMKESTFIAKSVSISNPDAVNIKSKGATSDFSGTISVERLATHASAETKDLFSVGEPKLSDEKFAESTLSKYSQETTISIGAPGKASIDLAFNSTDTMKTVLDRINKETDVNAFYDSFTGKIAMTAKESGKGIITIKGNLGIELGLNNDADNPNPGAIDGLNAKITYNGLVTERSSNTFEINGMEITLKKPTTESITFTSVPDTDKVVDAVTQFVNDYNKMIEELNAKLREPKYRSFQPLSAEEKKDMKENEIKLWEEKAMSGTLRNDPEISNMLTKLRTIMSSPVMGSDGKNIMLKDLGITASTSYTENGKLTINETKLREAIMDNPNKVYELFAKPSTESNGTTLADKGGLARQFRAVIDGSREVISAKAGSVGSVNDSFTLGRSLKDMNKQIERFEERLKLVENRYWKQFSAMESAIQRLNAQSASIMSSFGG